MLFNSWIFPAFLLVVLVPYFALGQRSQNRWLLATSYVFYGWWDWRFCSLLALSTAVDGWCAHQIHRSADPTRRRRLLTVSLLTNLGALGLFKYFDFFIESAGVALEFVGLQPNLPSLRVILPVGISFYTFQTMAYTIDVYRRQAEPAEDPLDFALYVAWFPQLVAGPIERATDLLPQLARRRTWSTDAFWSGADLVLWGFVKKVLIADSVAPWVDRVFDHPSELGRTELALGTYLFALQIYGDFSGYTDIARGVSRWLGVELSVNFRQPYAAANITDFWRRWHITLSSWLRDYLYIPLGGNRSGGWRTYRNNLVTMLLGGLWHGASVNFVVWGGLHGLYLAAHKLWLGGAPVPVPPTSGPRAVLRRWASVLFTFHLVCLGWIFFRAPTLAGAATHLEGLLFGPWRGPDGTITLGLATSLAVFGAVVVAIDAACGSARSDVPTLARWPAPARGALYAAALLALMMIGEEGGAPFVYFQF
jgi:alginate O-acetyltransferase complex protein AlgI